MTDARDFIGYGPNPPQVEWPGGARLAVSLALNYEEGSEHSLSFGDSEDEPMGEWGGYVSPPSTHRNRVVESVMEYGSRVGVWRLLNILSEYEVHGTFFACAMALEKNPLVARAIVDQGHEVCSHGYRWEDHYAFNREEERERIELAVRSFETTTGVRPVGWYSRHGFTDHTRKLLVDAGFLYDSNAYNDELPYWVKVGERDHLVVPYTPDVNDVRFWTTPGFITANDFFDYMKEGFDRLLKESAKTPRMMSVGLHMRIAGRPSRAGALERFLDYVRGKPGVWIARRDEIARWWVENGPRPA